MEQLSRSLTLEAAWVQALCRRLGPGGILFAISCLIEWQRDYPEISLEELEPNLQERERV